MLLALPLNQIEKLVYLLNITLDNGVIPVPKKNLDSSIITNNRPICLLSVTFKCLEALIKLRMEEHINKNKILPPRSYAFRKKHSTAQCINDVLNNIANLKARGFHVTAAVLDLSKAFDAVNIPILGSKLVSLGFDHNHIYFIINFLSKRVLTMGTAEVTVNKGVSQGSRILFNLYTAELHSLSNDHDSILFQYADDFFLVCYDKVFSMAEEKLEQKVNRFMELCNINNLTFNPDKSATIHFNLRKKPLVSCAIILF